MFGKPCRRHRTCFEFVADTGSIYEADMLVAPHEFLEFGGIHGFTMDRAGEETLARRLCKDGKLGIDLLERFGEELFPLVDFLDKEGIPTATSSPTISLSARPRERCAWCSLTSRFPTGRSKTWAWVRRPASTPS